MTLDLVILLAAVLFVICLGALLIYLISYLLLELWRGLAVIFRAVFDGERLEVPGEPVEREPVDAMVIRIRRHGR